MSSTALVLIGALIGAVPTAIGAVIAWRKVRPENRNTDANTTKTIVEASGAVIEQLRAEQVRLGAEVAQLRLALASTNHELALTNEHVAELERLMRAAGLTPPPRPTIPREDKP